MPAGSKPVPGSPYRYFERLMERFFGEPTERVFGEESATEAVARFTSAIDSARLLSAA